MRRKDKKRPEQAPPPARFPFKETLCAVAFILAVGLWAYWNSFSGQFIYDDNQVVANLRTHSFWQFVALPVNRARLLVSFSLAANYALGGTEVWGYHAFNLAVHLLAALTLFGILRRTLRLEPWRERFDSAAGWLALTAALLWLVHPLQTESVTYIWQRCESLAGLFYLLALYCVIRGAETTSSTQKIVSQSSIANRKSSIWYILAVLACALGLGCKATMVTAPVIIFCYDRIFLARDAQEAWRKRWPLYAGLAGTWLLLAALLYSAPSESQAHFSMAEWAGGIYLRTEPGVVLHYLCLAFWPSNLCLDYNWQPAAGLHEILPGVLATGCLLGATLLAWWRRQAWSFAGIWFFGILVPTTFLPLLRDLAFEHRMYLSLAAVAAAVAIALYFTGAKIWRRLSLPRALAWPAGAAATLALTLPLGYRTLERNADYQSRLGMWQDVLRQRPENSRAWSNAGCELLDKGENAKALAYFNWALALDPQFMDAFRNRGLVFFKNGDYGHAAADYTKALELDPKNAKTYFDRGSARKEKGDVDGAIADFTAALEINPNYSEACNNRGATFYSKGDCQKAAADFSRALQINPRDLNALLNLGLTHLQNNSYDEAIAEFSRLLEFSPDFSAAYANRGVAREKKGDNGGAAADFNQALALDPSNWQVWTNKGLLLQKLGKEAEAQECFAKGRKSNPNK
jgi:tetratricopeptide (TPR) repeat protein